LDDGARTWEDTLEMARLLVELGFSTIAASPHNRPEFAPKAVALERLQEVQDRLRALEIPLTLEPNSENNLLDERFFHELGTPSARPVGRGPYVLVEAPFQSPVPSLLDLIFRMKLKGITPLFAHPERCLEFERPGRAAEAVRGGAALQLDVGALIGRYGRMAKRLATEFLEADLYAVAATDLHSPMGARDWLNRAFDELLDRVEDSGFRTLLQANPQKVLAGTSLV
jgi:protein-tyrosine phosphatase